MPASDCLHRTRFRPKSSPIFCANGRIRARGSNSRTRAKPPQCALCTPPHNPAFSKGSRAVGYNPDERGAVCTPAFWSHRMTIDIQEILGLLPHRYPFLLIDRIVEFERTKRLVAIKNVTINEPFFQGHFPGYPIMPGVLVVEAMAQAGGIIIMYE